MGCEYYKRIYYASCVYDRDNAAKLSDDCCVWRLSCAGSGYCALVCGSMEIR